MKRFLKYASILLLAALIGAAGGFFYARKELLPASQLMAQTSALAEYETLVELQYRNADYSHAKDALLGLVNFMNQMQGRQKIIGHRAFANDECIAFMRLALLEEKAGHKEDSQRYIQQARNVLDREYNKQYSEQYVRTFVAKADSLPEF